MTTLLLDPHFNVAVIQATPDPNRVCYLALHQDYSEDWVMAAEQKVPNETRCGEIVVERLLKGDRGHYGVLEHISITLACGWFPHDVMVQARTHRIASFDCQSQRYTGTRVLELVDGKREEEEVFYARPVGKYRDRQGNMYEYTEAMRRADLDHCYQTAVHYARLIREHGMAPEHARGCLAQAIRQHFVVTFNARSLMHFLDLRYKADAQPEIQTLAYKMLEHFHAWMPEVAAWYDQTRLGKARLAP